MYEILGIDTYTCQKGNPVGINRFINCILAHDFLFVYSDLKLIVLNQCFNFVDHVKFDSKGHFTHETESP